MYFNCVFIRTYLEVLLDLPWSKRTPDTLDINKARHDLNNDHYGLEKVKKRILEYLAVLQLKNSLKGMHLYVQLTWTIKICSTSTCTCTSK